MTAADIKALGYRVYEAIKQETSRPRNSLIPTLSGMQEKQVSRALKKPC